MTMSTESRAVYILQPNKTSGQDLSKIGLKTADNAGGTDYAIGGVTWGIRRTKKQLGSPPVS